MTDALTLLDLLADNFKEIRRHLDVFARAHLQRVCKRVQAEDPGNLLQPIWRTNWEIIKEHPLHLDLWCALLEARLDQRSEPSCIAFYWGRAGVAASVRVDWVYAPNGDIPFYLKDNMRHHLFLYIETDQRQWRHAVAMKKPTLSWAREFDGPPDPYFVPAGLLDIMDEREPELHTRMDPSKRRPRSSQEYRFRWVFETKSALVRGWDALTVLPEHEMIGVFDPLKWTKKINVF